jgi:hypothetical protein
MPVTHRTDQVRTRYNHCRNLAARGHGVCRGKAPPYPATEGLPRPAAALQRMRGRRAAVPPGASRAAAGRCSDTINTRV